MQRIDRTRRHFIYKLRSGKRVLIILVAIGGILLIFSYVVQLQSQNLIRKQFYESDVKKWDGIHKRKLTAEYYGHHSDHTLKTTESSTKVETLSVDDNGLDTNTFITIGGGADLTTTTEGRTNDSEFYHYDQDTFDPFEPFLDQFSQSAFSDMKADSRSKPFKNNLFTFYCKNSRVRRVQKRNKNLIVYENFIAPNHNMKCDESIFYTTHGDYRYLLNNLIPLVVRWNGPVSVAIYCPGNDLRKTLKIINFLRSCTIERIRELVTFHLFFDVAYSTPVVGKSHWQWLDSMYQEETWRNCSERPNPRRLATETTFRIQNKLLYPVNVARNVARNAAYTHFVLASDIELYPSINLIPSFFKMLHEQHKANGNGKNVIIPARQVYVLPIFEVKQGVKPPETKEDLIPLLQKGDAITFHNHICPECHLVPKFSSWIKTSSANLHVFYSAKRAPPHQFWEPIFIGTTYDPPYDERLTLEGLRDKMTQGYILCVLDYDFLILSNAFLIHRPGIKRLNHKTRDNKIVLRQDRLINFKIKVELFRRFGKQGGCTL